MPDVHSSAPQRVRFLDGQVLHAADLNDESDYLLSLRRRHDAAAHSWGIVSGLQLQGEPSGFVVSPGFAWDGYGRALVLTEEQFRPWQVPGQPAGRNKDIFEHLNAVIVDVWLIFQRQPHDGADRQQESAKLCFTHAVNADGRANFDPWQPWGVAPGRIARAPHRPSPDDPEQLWPVYLGSLSKETNSYTVNLEQRVYAGLVGQRIVSAARQQLSEAPDATAPPPFVAQAEMTLDGEALAPLRRRFAVSVRDETGAAVERLAFEDPRRAILRGHLILHEPGDLLDRTLAADLILEMPLSALQRDDICDAQCIIEKAHQFEFDPEEPALHLLQAGPPPDPIQTAQVVLNTLLLQPDLYQQQPIQALALSQTALNLIALIDRPAPTWRTQRVRGTVVAASSYLDLLQKTVLPLLYENMGAGELRTPLGARLAQVPKQRSDQLRQEVAPLLQNPHIRNPFEKALVEHLQEKVGLSETSLTILNQILLKEVFAEALCDEGAAREANALSFAPLAAPPEDPLPWSVYRTDIPADEESGQEAQRQLRIEFEEFGDPLHPDRSQVAIGHFVGPPGPDAFRRCLWIDEQCTLHVEGDLSVEGNLVMRPPAPGSDAADGAGLPLPVQPSFDDAVAQQAVAPSTLKITVPAFAPRRSTDWPYDVNVKNTGSEPLRFVLLMESFAINNGSPSDTVVSGGVQRLDPQEMVTITVTHQNNLPNANVNVSVQLTAMAYTPANRVMYESEDISANAVP